MTKSPWLKKDWWIVRYSKSWSLRFSKSQMSSSANACRRVLEHHLASWSSLHVFIARFGRKTFRNILALTALFCRTKWWGPGRHVAAPTCFPPNRQLTLVDRALGSDLCCQQSGPESRPKLSKPNDRQLPSRVFSGQMSPPPKLPSQVSTRQLLACSFQLKHDSHHLPSLLFSAPDVRQTRKSRT